MYRFFSKLAFKSLNKFLVKKCIRLTSGNGPLSDIAIAEASIYAGTCRKKCFYCSNTSLCSVTNYKIS